MQCPLFIFLSNISGLNQKIFLIQIKLFVPAWSTLFCVQSSIIMIFLSKRIDWYWWIYKWNHMSDHILWAKIWTPCDVFAAFVLFGIFIHIGRVIGAGSFLELTKPSDHLRCAPPSIHPPPCGREMTWDSMDGPRGGLGARTQEPPWWAEEGRRCWGDTPWPASPT